MIINNDSFLVNTSDSSLTEIFLFGEASLDMLNVTTNYIISTKIFEEILF